MAEAKLLKPPHVWSTATRAVEEDRRYQRWTASQVRAMKNGTYDWSKHEENALSGK